MCTHATSALFLLRAASVATDLSQSYKRYVIVHYLPSGTASGTSSGVLTGSGISSMGSGSNAAGGSVVIRTPRFPVSTASKSPKFIFSLVGCPAKPSEDPIDHDNRVTEAWNKLSTKERAKYHGMISMEYATSRRGGWLAFPMVLFEFMCNAFGEDAARFSFANAMGDSSTQVAQMRIEIDELQKKLEGVGNVASI